MALLVSVQQRVRDKCRAYQIGSAGAHNQRAGLPGKTVAPATVSNPRRSKGDQPIDHGGNESAHLDVAVSRKLEKRRKKQSNRFGVLNLGNQQEPAQINRATLQSLRDNQPRNS